MKITYLCFLLLVIFSVSLPADDHADTQSVRRLEADGKLTETATAFLTSHFFLPESYIRNRFELSLPQSIEKALKGDETASSAIISEFMGVVNNKQIETLVDDAAEIAKTEREIKNPEKRDDRYIALMDRLVWAGKSLLNSDSKDEKAQDFNEQFKKDIKKTDEWNALANEKLQQAASGIESAQTWVKENISMKSILTFAEGQKKTGNSAAAEKIVGALSTKIGKERVLDMWNGAESQRLYLGNSTESLKTALNGLFENNGGFLGATAAKQAHPQAPKKSWYMDEKGQFNSGIPERLKIVEIIKPPLPPPQKPNVQTDIAPVRALSEKSCKSCHAIAVEGTTIQNARFLKDGERFTFKQVVGEFTNPNNPAMLNLTPAVRAQITAWAALQK